MLENREQVRLDALDLRARLLLVQVQLGEAAEQLHLTIFVEPLQKSKDGLAVRD